MRLLSITVENFGPLNGKHTINLSRLNATTVSGRNEAGKSYFFIDAPLFALFGKARKRPEGLINDLHDECTVKVEIVHLKESYTVQRSIKRGKTQTLKLWHGEKNISERLLGNTQKKLDSILGFSYNLLLSTAVAQQDEINMLSSMGATDREEILNEMLGNEHWETKKKKVGDILNEYKDVPRLISEKETELVVLNQDLEEHETQIQSIKETKLLPGRTSLTLLEKDIKQLEKDREAWETDSKIANQFSILEAEVKFLKTRVDSVPVDDGIQDRITSLEVSIAENDQLTKDAKEYRKPFDLEFNRIASKIYEINHLISLEPGTKVLQDVPCVGMAIHDQCKLLHNSVINKQKIDNFLKDYIDEDLPTLLKIEENKREKVLQQIKEIEDTIKVVERENIEYANQIENSRWKLEGIQNGQEIINKYQTKKAELCSILPGKAVTFDINGYKELGNKIHRVRNDLQIAELQLVKLETEKEHLDKNKKVTEIMLKGLQETESNIAGYRTLYTAYNEIPTMLFEEAMPLIEQYTNEILQKISPERTIQLRSFKENKNGNVQKALDVVSQQATGTRDFDDLSGSAKFRQSLALRIALARYNRERHNTEIDFFIVDEGFGSLDNSNVFLMKTMLKDIASHFDLFLMISHIEDLKDVFDTQIVINGPGKAERISII